MLARSLAWELGYPLEVYETRLTSTAIDLFYTYNALGQFHVAQLDAKRAATAVPADGGGPTELDRPERQALRFVRYNALGAAIVRACPLAEVADLLPTGFEHPGEPVRSVVLLDEIDKSPRDLPNDVLSALDAMAFTIPELGNARLARAARTAADPGDDQQLREGTARPLPPPLHLLPHPVPRNGATPGDRGRPDRMGGPPGRAARRRPGTVRAPAEFDGDAQEAGDGGTSRLADGPAAPERQRRRQRGLATAPYETLRRSLPCLVKTVEDLPTAEEELRRWVERRAEEVKSWIDQPKRRSR